VSFVAIFAVFTVRLTASEVLVLKSVLPSKTAVIECAPTARSRRASLEAMAFTGTSASAVAAVCEPSTRCC